jgi:hypothetical protein
VPGFRSGPEDVPREPQLIVWSTNGLLMAKSGVQSGPGRRLVYLRVNEIEVPVGCSRPRWRSAPSQAEVTYGSSCPLSGPAVRQRPVGSILRPRRALVTRATARAPRPGKSGACARLGMAHQGAAGRFSPPRSPTAGPRLRAPKNPAPAWRYLPGTFVTKARCLAAHRRTEPRAAARSARQPTMANRLVTLTGERHRDEYGQPEADTPGSRTSY